MGSVVTLLVGIGYACVSLVPGDFKRARVCFYSAAALLGVMEMVWYTQSGWPFAWRLAVASAICLVIGVGLPETLRWVHRREMLVISPPISQPHEAAEKTADVPRGELPVRDFDLRGHIIQVAIGWTSPEHKSIGGAVVANIKNLGQPTVLDDWQIFVTPAKGDRLRAEIMVDWQTLQLGSDRSSPEVFKRDKGLIDQATTQPIPTNGQIYGVVPFVIGTRDLNRFMKKDTRVALVYHDVKGGEHSAEFALQGRDMGTHDYIYGIGALTKKPASDNVVCQVVSAHFEPVFRFFQSPPVYFQRLDAMLRVGVTNQTGKPLHLRRYSVAALKGIEWIQFKNADSAAFEPYAFGTMVAGDKGFIRRFNLSSNGFDYVTQQRPINPNESIELWMFFISGLTRNNLPEISQFKFAFHDSANQAFQCTSAYSAQSDKGIVLGTSTGDLIVLNPEPIPANLREEPPH